MSEMPMLFNFRKTDLRENRWHDLGIAKRDTGAGTKLVNCSVINVRRHRIQHDVKEEKPVIYQMLKSVNALGK